jgi:branched-chain amino acid transport system substrate-binding protein
MRSKSISVLALTILVALVWSFPLNYALAQGDVIKIGTIFSRTGPLANLGLESWRGSELARINQNNRGGVLGKKIEFVNTDAPDPKAAVSETERLCTVEKVSIIIGSFSSSISFAASAKANQHKVIYFETGGIADNITQRGLKYLFRTCAPGRKWGEGQAELALNVIAPGIGKTKDTIRIAAVYEDSGYGTAMTAGARDLLKSRGVEFVADESYNFKTMDLSSLVMRLKEKKPDVIIASQYENDGILFFRQAQEVGLKFTMLIGTGAGTATEGYRQALGKAVDGRVCNCSYPGFSLNPKYAKGIDELMNLYVKAFGRKPESIFVPNGYMGTMVLWDIIKRAGSTDPEAIVKAAQETDISGNDTLLRHGVKFAPPGSKEMGQNVLATVFLEQWQDGNTYVVWPAEAALPGIKLKILPPGP